MAQHVSALLVYDQSPLLDRLKCALHDRSLSAGRARTCQEAEHLIKATEPHLIFTDTKLPDGSWADVVRCGEKAEVATNVIVVADSADIGFYIKVMEGGAFDYILPPFEAQDLNHVVGCALSNVLSRRSDQVPALAAS